MADAAARREARRKRILENSENRLQRITGGNINVREDKSSNSFIRESTNTENDFVSDTNANPEPAERQSYIFGKAHLEEKDFLTQSLSDDLCKRNIASEGSVDDTFDLINHTVRNERFSLNERQSNIVNKATNESEQEVNPHDSTRRVSAQTSLSFSLFTSKWILVLLAALVNVLYILQLQHLYGRTILAPFFALMLVRLHLADSNSRGQGGSMLSAALILCNIKPELVYNMRTVIRILKKITEEFSIYIFCFVIFYNVTCLYWNDIDATISTIVSENNEEL